MRPTGSPSLLGCTFPASKMGPLPRPRLSPLTLSPPRPLRVLMSMRACMQTSPFFRWVSEVGFNCQVAVFAFQEVEMGSTSVALGAAKDAIAYKLQVCMCGRGGSHAHMHA
jgi:hypothetical protein